MRPLLLLSAAAIVLPIAATAQAMDLDQYYPNRVNETLVFSYSTAAEGERRQSYAGTLIRSPAGTETRGGVTYQTVENATEGLPDFYPGRWKSYHRETGQGLYSGQVNEAGEVEEYLELPASAEPGEPWDVSSAFWESQTFSPVPRMETDAGTFEQCIRVERFREDAPSGQKLTNITTYCPGVSAVHSTVEHVAPEFRSVTEMRLIEIRP